MQAKALVTHKDQSFELADVTLPDVGPDEIQVKTRYSGVSIGTEFAIIRGELERGYGPLPTVTGYQAVGVVEQTGENVTEFDVGETVYYRGNRSMKLSDGTEVSANSGLHSSAAILDVKRTYSDAYDSIGVWSLPNGADEATASTYVLPAVGLHGVDKAGVEVDDTVVVYGTGLVGLAVVAMANQRGAEIAAIDLQQNRLDIAEKLGADHVINNSQRDEKEAVAEVFPQGQGPDVVFEATGIADCVNPALELCRRFGKFVFQGNYGDEPLPLDFQIPHGKRLDAFFPCGAGGDRCQRAVVKHMASGVLPWEHTITHDIAAREAPDFYARINDGDVDDAVGITVDWTEIDA